MGLNIIRKGHGLRIAVGITMMTIMLLAGGAGALPNAGGGSWQFFKDITISNTGGCVERNNSYKQYMSCLAAVSA